MVQSDSATDPYLQGGGVKRPRSPGAASPRAEKGKARTAKVQIGGKASRGRHCHSTLSLVVMDCRSLGIYTVILLSLLSLSVIMSHDCVAPG